MFLPKKVITQSDDLSTSRQCNANKKTGVCPPSASAVTQIDQKLSSFLTRINLPELIGIFAKEDLSLEDLMKLSYEDLKEIGVDKFKHRKLIAEELEKIRMPLRVVLSSSGRTAQHQRGMLGQYDYDVERGHYVQTSTEGESELYSPVYMYPDTDHKWWVGPCPGAKAGWLHNPAPSKKLPEFLTESDWQCWVAPDKMWTGDPYLTIFPGPLSDLSPAYTVTASGDAARRLPAALGMFTMTQRWWNGRPVFENNKGWFLHHGQSVGWMIGSKIGRHELMGSTWSHYSPASEKDWRYFDSDASKFKPATLCISVSNLRYQLNQKSVFDRWI